MYRPEGWPKCPCDDCEQEEIDDYGYVCELACGERSRWFNREAGADAMLEGLKNKGVFTYGHHTPDIDLDDAPNESGYWCFIPEENNG